MSPTFQLDAGRLLSKCLRARVTMQEGSKGRIEVREATSFKLRFHVPVGVLKFSCEKHVDSSTVQQTLAITDSSIDSPVATRRRDLEGDAEHLG